MAQPLHLRAPGTVLTLLATPQRSLLHSLKMSSCTEGMSAVRGKPRHEAGNLRTLQSTSIKLSVEVAVLKGQQMSIEAGAAGVLDEGEGFIERTGLGSRPRLRR